MKLPKIPFPEKLLPFKGVILFAIILMASNYVWKYNVLGDESESTDSLVTFLGMNISWPFVWMARHVTEVSGFILNFFGFDMTFAPGNVLRHPNGNSVQVIWACTGLKQAYIFFCIIAFYRGPWAKKLWYIPLGLLAVYLFNIFRITFIISLYGKYPESFHFLHLYVFKYGFYLLIFGLWVWWEEKIAGKKTELKTTVTTAA